MSGLSHEDSAEGVWGSGNAGHVCLSAGPVATCFRVYPSLADGRVLSSRSHALLPPWGADVVFKTLHSSDGSHSAILKASGVLSPCALHCYTFGTEDSHLKYLGCWWILRREAVDLPRSFRFQALRIVGSRPVDFGCSSTMCFVSSSSAPHYLIIKQAGEMAQWVGKVFKHMLTRV